MPRGIMSVGRESQADTNSNVGGVAGRCLRYGRRGNMCRRLVHRATCSWLLALHAYWQQGVMRESDVLTSSSSAPRDSW
jgi:hypothetical protein